MKPLSLELEKRLRRATPRARLMVDAVQEVQVDGKDLPSEWQGWDAGTSGVRTINRGGMQLTAALADSVVAAGSSGTYITDLDNASPFEVAEIVWGGGSDHDQDIDTVVCRLVAQRNGANPKTVAYWRVQLFRVANYIGGSDADWILEPISEPSTVSAASGGTTPGDVVFPLIPAAGTDPRDTATVKPGPGPGRDFDEGNEGSDAAVDARSRTIVMLWALRSDGSPADNVGWDTDDTVAQKTSTVDTTDNIFRRTLQTADAGPVDHQGRTRVFVAGTPTGVPDITLRSQPYPASVAVSYTTSPITLAALAGTTDLEVVAEGLTPAGTGITWELHDGTSWFTVNDGDLIGEDNTARGGADLSTMAVTTSYAARVTLISNATQTATPTAMRLQVREVTITDLDGIAVVHGGKYQINPESLRGEVTEVAIEVLKDGNVDYRDFATELASENFPGQYFFRVRMGHPELDRKYWMHLDDFYPETPDPQGASIRFTCLSALHYIKQVLPVYVAGQKTSLEYINQSLQAASDDILTGQVVIPDRAIGPGILDNTTTVSKVIQDSEAKAELDALGVCAGGGWTTSRGRIVFADLHAEQPPVRAFDRREIAWLETPTGLDRRVPEFFQPFSWLESDRIYNGEVRSFHLDSINRLGAATLDTLKKSDDIVSRWIDSQALAETVAQRKTKYQGAGLLEWTFDSVYPYPELEVGDRIVVPTDLFVSRDPSTQTPIRGEVTAVGVISKVHNLWGTRFTVWIQTYADIIPSEQAITLAGYGLTGQFQWSIIPAIVSGSRGCYIDLHYQLAPQVDGLQLNFSYDRLPGPTTETEDYTVALSGEGTHRLQSDDGAGAPAGDLFFLEDDTNITLNQLRPESGGVNGVTYSGIDIPDPFVAGYGMVLVDFSTSQEYLTDKLLVAGDFAIDTVSGRARLTINPSSSVVTGLAANSGLDISSNLISLDFATLALPGQTMTALDRFVYYDDGDLTEYRIAPVNIPLSLFTDDIGAGPPNAGAAITVTGGNTVNVNFAAGANNVISAAPNTPITVVGTDAIIVADGGLTGAVEAVILNTINVGVFNDDGTYLAPGDAVTSVGAGTGLSSSGGTTPSISLNFSALADRTLVGGDKLVFYSPVGAGHFTDIVSGIGLSNFLNDAGFVTSALDTASTGLVEVSGDVRVKYAAAADNLIGAAAALVGEAAAADAILLGDGGVSGEVKSVLLGDINVSLFDNDAGYGTGTVTSVGAGTGLDSSGGTAPTITLSLDELSDRTLAGTDRLVFYSPGGAGHFTDIVSGIGLSNFLNDAGFVTSALTSASTGLTAVGNDVRVNYAAGAGNLIGAATALVGEAAAADAILLADGGVSGQVKSALLGDLNISLFDNDAGYTTNIGDITAVTAGNGLTGGGTSGGVTLNVGAGAGISVAADTVGVDSTVVRTTGAQSIAGAKTFTDNMVISGAQLRIAPFAASSSISFNNSNFQTLTNSGARTITFSNPAAGGSYVLWITDASGAAASWTWPTVNWIDNTPPAFPQVIGDVTIVHLLYDGSSYVGYWSNHS